jgi:hypothetical protein
MRWQSNLLGWFVESRHPGDMMQPQRRTLENGWSVESSTEKMDTVVAELMSFLEALKSGSPFHYLILLAVVLIGLALTIAAVAYQRVVIKWSQTASKAARENFEAIAADLRTRALEVKKQDEGLRKRDLEKERDELKGSVEDAEPQRPQQKRQVLKGSQRALKGSVSYTMLQTDFKGMTSVVPGSSKAGLQRKSEDGTVKNSDRQASIH